MLFKYCKANMSDDKEGSNKRNVGFKILQDQPEDPGTEQGWLLKQRPSTNKKSFKKQKRDD